MGRVHSSLAMDRRARILSAHMAPLIPDEAWVLDIGAGNGKLSSALKARRPRLEFHGVDTFLWPHRAIEVTKFDGRTLPFADESFDGCLISDVLHHCGHPENLLGEARRVSRDFVIIKDHVADTRADFTLLMFMDWVGNRGHDVVLPYNYWSWPEWERAFENAGLNAEHVIRRLGLYPRPLSLVFDRGLHFIAKLTKA